MHLASHRQLPHLHLSCLHLNHSTHCCFPVLPVTGGGCAGGHRRHPQPGQCGQGPAEERAVPGAQAVGPRKVWYKNSSRVTAHCTASPRCHALSPPPPLHMLCVSQGGLQTANLPILRGMNGVLRPGSVTLLLGPPGAGKTVFLQTLAGRLQGKRGVRVRGGMQGGADCVACCPSCTRNSQGSRSEHAGGVGSLHTAGAAQPARACGSCPPAQTAAPSPCPPRCPAPSSSTASQPASWWCSARWRTWTSWTTTSPTSPAWRPASSRTSECCCQGGAAC